MTSRYSFKTTRSGWKHQRKHQNNMHQDVARTPRMGIRTLRRLMDGVYGSYLSLEMSAGQLLIISAMIDRLRSRWGLPVIRQRRHRRSRFRPWPTWAELEEEGQYSRPMPMHHLDDPMAYRNFIQMLPELCQELEQRITAEFQRDRTLMRDPVSPGVKLAVALRHSDTTLQYAFRVTIEQFVSEVCDAITRAYQGQVMQCPTLPENWLLVKSIVRRRWKFPHALGALNGKHIPIRCPQGGGSLFRNSKDFHSIVLLALVDGDSKFLWVDMGELDQLQMIRFSSTPILDTK